MRILVLFLTIFLVSTPVSAGHDHDSFIQIVEETRKAIVVVLVKLKDEDVKSEPVNPLEEYLKPKEDPEEPEEERKVDAFGTGFIIDNNHIITNNHVIDNNEHVYITFENDQKMYAAEVVSSDPMIDIAILKLKDESRLTGIEPLKWSMEGVLPGQDVWAIGHPLGMEFTVSKGIVSHVKRQISNGWQGFIQTDVSINKGNSGGPLLNMDGEVVAVNTIIMSPNSNGSIGISLSVDSKVASRVISLLLKDGVIHRPIMGTELEFDTDLLRVKIRKVREGSPAERDGVLKDDQFVDIDGIAITKIADIFGILQTKLPDDVIKINMMRGGQLVQIVLTLGELGVKDIQAQVENSKPKK